MTGSESQLAASSQRCLWHSTRTAPTDTSRQFHAKRRRIAVVRWDLAESESGEPLYGLAHHPCDDTLRFAPTMTQSTRPPSPNDGRQDAGIPTQHMARIMRLVPKNGCIRFRCRQVSTEVLVLAQPTNDSLQAFFDLLSNTGPSFILNGVDLPSERVAGFLGTRRTNTESATKRASSSKLPGVSMCRTSEERGGRQEAGAGMLHDDAIQVPGPSASIQQRYRHFDFLQARHAADEVFHGTLTIWLQTWYTGAPNPPPLSMPQSCGEWPSYAVVIHDASFDIDFRAIKVSLVLNSAQTCANVMSFICLGFPLNTAGVRWHSVSRSRHAQIKERRYSSPTRVTPSNRYAVGQELQV
ncbi:hypothetical protein BKA70DRAFT_1430014 [Coprinopsis sp. MPI-PUGE-AT-0042]|nr:hypothetical protein BKA70DRAFT_1430014 [Coprinopsis sp. MPI-PUGE-AT-0042]